MAFEKERRYNNIVMAVGFIAAAAGLIAYFMLNKSAGIALLIIGVALLIITFSISNALFKIKMIEMMKNRKNK